MIKTSEVLIKSGKVLTKVADDLLKIAAVLIKSGIVLTKFAGDSIKTWVVVQFLLIHVRSSIVGYGKA